jgi:hypothetical protein
VRCVWGRNRLLCSARAGWTGRLCTRVPAVSEHLRRRCLGLDHGSAPARLTARGAVIAGARREILDLQQLQINELIN